MTLRELLNETIVDAETVDICAWNEETEDYDDIIGFYDCNDLEDALLHSSEENQRYFDYKIHYIESYEDCGKAVLRIEVTE